MQRLAIKIIEEIISRGPVLMYGYVKQSLVFKIEQKLNDTHSVYSVEDPIQIRSAMGYLLNKTTAADLLKVIYPVKDASDSWAYFTAKELSVD